MTAPPMIEASGLTKRYGSTQALAGVDLEVPTGSILAVLGPNGAGKTTAVRILTTLATPDGGRALVAGHDVVRDAAAVRNCIGVTAQDATVDLALTGRQNLTMIGRLSGLSRKRARDRATELLGRFELTDAADRVLKGYSGGMRRRLDLAAGIVTRPPVLFLDEPTTGLDPTSRARMWRVIRDLVAEGTTLLLTTQYLDEADELAHQIAVLDDGRIVAEGSPAELKSRIPGGHVRLHFADLHEFHSAAELLPAAGPDQDQLVLQVPADDSVDSLRELLDDLHRARIQVERLSIHTPDLDDVFLAVTGSHVSAQPNQDPAPQGAER
jgi:ABC-2 type transport system ATP-binding protein